MGETCSQRLGGSMVMVRRKYAELGAEAKLGLEGGCYVEQRQDMLSSSVKID